MKIFILAMILIGLANTIVLHQNAGVFSFPVNVNKIKTTAWLAALVLLGTVVSAAVTSVLYEPVLVGTGLVKLKAVIYLLAAVCMGCIYALVLKAKAPAAYAGFGKYVPLVTADIGLVGVALFFVQKSFTMVRGAGAGFSAGVLFALILLAMSAAQGKMGAGARPVLKNVLLVIYAALMAVALWGLGGLPL